MIVIHTPVVKPASSSKDDILADGNGRILRSILDKYLLNYQLVTTSQELAEALSSAPDGEVILPCGDLALSYLGEDRSSFQLRGHPFYYHERFIAMPLVSPDLIRRNWLYYSITMRDVKKALQLENKVPILKDNIYVLTHDNSLPIFFDKVEAHPEGEEITLDIEGYPNHFGITVFGVGFKDETLVVPLAYRTGAALLSNNGEAMFLESLEKLFAKSTVVCHNALYELVSCARMGLQIPKIQDTMLASYTLHPDYPKSLNFTSSLYSTHPYHKDERTSDGEMDYWQYNGKDVVVTKACWERMKEAFTPEDERAYSFYIKTVPVYAQAVCNGIRIDKDAFAKEEVRLFETIKQLHSLFLKYPHTANVNPASPKQLQTFLYDSCKFPKQFQWQTKKLTTDIIALAEIYKATKAEVILILAALTRCLTRFSDLQKYQPAQDGRIYTGFSPIGTKTGRASSSSGPIHDIIQKKKLSFKRGMFHLEEVWPKYGEIGSNLQNVHKSIRHIFIADEGKTFAQFDLSGADAWTVGYETAQAGDRTMLIHMENGIKPSKVIVGLRRAKGSLPTNTLEDYHAIADLCPAGPEYISAKRCQHGTNYGMKVPMMISVLVKDEINAWADKVIASQGWKPFPPAPNLIQFTNTLLLNLQRNYKELYAVEARHRYIEHQLKQYKKLTAASGQSFRFNAHRSIDNACLREALATIPQANTTYATNLAMLSLAEDPNIDIFGMVHDSVIFQAPSNYSKDDIYTHFQQPINILGNEVILPVEGGFGPNWKATD